MTERLSEREEWRDIKGYEGLYQVSNMGRIKSFHGKKPKILSARITNGYDIPTLCKGSFQEKISTHRIVAYTFLENYEQKPEVNHKNGIKTDNRVCNLEWVTRSENILHGVRTGLIPIIGSQHPQSKLKEEDVKYIRSMKGIVPRIKLAAKFNVSITLIGIIMRNEAWKRA